jgi:hypothetical protein
MALIERARRTGSAVCHQTLMGFFPGTEAFQLMSSSRGGSAAVVKGAR